MVAPKRRSTPSSTRRARKARSSSTRRSVPRCGLPLTRMPCMSPRAHAYGTVLQAMRCQQHSSRHLSSASVQRQAATPPAHQRRRASPAPRARGGCCARSAWSACRRSRSPPRPRHSSSWTLGPARRARPWRRSRARAAPPARRAPAARPARPPLPGAAPRIGPLGRWARQTRTFRACRNMQEVSGRREAAAVHLPTTMTGSGAALLGCAGLQRLPLPAGRGSSPSAACGTSLNRTSICLSSCTQRP